MNTSCWSSECLTGCAPPAWLRELRFALRAPLRLHRYRNLSTRLARAAVGVLDAGMDGAIPGDPPGGDGRGTHD